MIESDASRLRMLKAVGGVPVRHSGGSFYAVFENGSQDASFEDFDVEGRQPSLMARTSDVESLPKDTALDVVLDAGVEQYRLTKHEPDGTGMSRVILRR